MRGSSTRVQKRPAHLNIGLAILLIIGAAISAPADARSIRVDSGGWTEGSSDSTGQLGFNFNFFGVETSTVEISGSGQVSFGGASISPFLFSDQDLDFSWSNTSDAPPLEPGDQPPLPDGILAGFRVCWGCFSDATEFQLSLYDLGGGQYAMEFNYAGLAAEDGAFIGYDNGQGVNFDMLEALGLEFPAWAGFSEVLCPGGEKEGDTDAIACNNYDFSTDTASLNDGYGGYFASDPSFGEPVLGRYFFLINAQADVPEPDSAMLLLGGFLILSRMRRRARKPVHAG